MRPTPTRSLLVTLPKLDRATQAIGVVLGARRGGRRDRRLPARARRAAGLDRRAPCARQRQRARPETLAFLADRCEGNLLAARQEIEKLAPARCPRASSTHEAVERAVTDVARYDVFELSEAWLAGDAARALSIIAALEAEGEGLPLLLWQLGEDVHALAAVLEANGRAACRVAAAVRNARVWGKRQAALERAARRVKPDAIAPMLRALATPRRAGEGHRPRQRLGRPAHAGADARGQARRCRCPQRAPGKLRPSR